MSAEENKALVTRVIAAINAGKSEVIDEAFANSYSEVPL
jgi:hypothetical protein